MRFLIFMMQLLIKLILKNNKVSGVLTWEDDDDVQEFMWNISSDINNYKNITVLTNFLVQNNLFEGDKINISKDILSSKLVSENIGWTTKTINETIDSLCSIRIAMIDEGETSDYFLIHF